MYIGKKENKKKKKLALELSGFYSFFWLTIISSDKYKVYFEILISEMQSNQTLLA